MLQRAVAEGRAPTFGALLERGVLVPDCVSSFPSVTPVACAEMVTGVGADRHWISGMNWYHRLERRYVEYGSSLEASRAFGIFRSLYDLVYNMNLAHLSPEVETLFEQLDDAGARTACTPFLIYRGRHRHQVSLDGLLRRAVDATRLKFRHHTWGPAELFYGDLYASREVPCRSTSIPGSRDGYSACCAAELAKGDLFDFLLLSLPDNDNYCHRHGPEASVESISKADHCFAKLVEAAGGLDRVPRGQRADPALPTMPRLRWTAACRWPRSSGASGRSCSPPRTGPSWRSSRSARPGGRPTSTCCPARESEPSTREVGRRLAETEGVELVCWLEGSDGQPLDRREPGMPAGGGEEAVVERGGERLRFRPGGAVSDLRGGRWEVEGELSVLEAVVEDGRLRSEEFPDPLARVWSALTAPHAGDFVVSLALGYEAVDWGGVTHVPGGSHGSLHRGDSLGPPALRRLRPKRPCRAHPVDTPRRRPRGAGALRRVKRLASSHIAARPLVAGACECRAGRDQLNEGDTGSPTATPTRSRRGRRTRA